MGVPAEVPVTLTLKLQLAAAGRVAVARVTAGHDEGLEPHLLGLSFEWIDAPAQGFDPHEPQAPLSAGPNPFGRFAPLDATGD